MDQASAVSGLRYLVPELVVLGTATAALFAHAFFRKTGHRLAGWVSLAGLVAGAALVFASPRSAGAIFSGSLVADPFAAWFKLSVLLSAALATVLAFRFFDVEGSEPGEVYVLMPLSLVGMMAAVSSVDLVSTYVAFELFAIPSYVLAGILELCVEMGGSITGEHGVGEEKKHFMSKMFAEPDLETMQLVRCAFDPERLSNPDKVFPRTKLCAERTGAYQPHPLEIAGIAQLF